MGGYCAAPLPANEPPPGAWALRGGGHGHAFDIAHGPAGTPHGGHYYPGELAPELVKLPLAAIDGAEIATRRPQSVGKALAGGKGA